METPTFIEQYNKILNAYIKNELDPYSACACFVGNLLNNKPYWAETRDLDFDLDTNMDWNNPNLIIKINTECRISFIEGVNSIKKQSNDLYNLLDIIALEQNFLRKYNDGRNEESLYEAMSTTLEMLRDIHIAKGEIIENYIFTKRVLETI